MEPNNYETSRQQHRRFVRANTGSAFLEFLDANDLKLNRIEEISRTRGTPTDYFAFLQLPEDAKVRFGLSGDELLLVALHRKPQQSWFLPEIRAKLRKYDRISKTAVLVASADPNIEQLCRNAYVEPSTGYKTAHLAIPLTRIEATNSAPDRVTLLFDTFKKHAFTVDHFDTRVPVPEDMWGRAASVAAIEADLRSAQEGVAILGVRRVGKTSVLKKVLAQLESDPDHPRIVAYYDAQIDTVDATFERVTTDLATSLERSLADQGLPPLTAQFVNSSEKLRALVDHLTRHAWLVIAIDEIEWLVPTDRTVDKGRDYLRLFGFLRALKQKHGERLGLVLCGINETFCERSDINGHPNPSLDWYRAHHISFLDQQDTFSMLRELGRRMAISFSEGFLRDIWNAFGGHAYLVRQFCSEAARKIHPRPAELRRDDFQRAYAPFVQREDGVFASILNHLATFYPGEYETFRQVALQNSIPASNREIRHLVAYGLLCDVPGGDIELRLDALADYAIRHTAVQATEKRFSLISKLGEGVSGVVWEAIDRSDNSRCALKLYHSGISDTLARQEFAVLAALEGGCAPRPIGLVAHDGQTGLAMEFIEGKSLESVLKQRRTIRGSNLALLSGCLFRALETLHPDVKRLAKLRAQSDLSEKEWEELQELASSGYLHRDLKPANIIVTDVSTWQVRLIDLQLATPAARANRTLVGTPAYLPPGWGTERWDTSFDLYGLACILFECAFGSRPDASGWEHQLQILSRAGDIVIVKEFFERGLAASAVHRFRDTVEMRAAWELAVLALD